MPSANRLSLKARKWPKIKTKIDFFSQRAVVFIPNLADAFRWRRFAGSCVQNVVKCHRWSGASSQQSLWCHSQGDVTTHFPCPTSKWPRPVYDRARTLHTTLHSPFRWLSLSKLICFSNTSRAYPSCSSSSSSSWRSQLHSHSGSGDEWCRLLQLLAAATELACQRIYMQLSTHTVAPSGGGGRCKMCSAVWSSLATGAGWWWRQLELTVHVSFQSVVSGTEPHQNNVLLSRQEVVVVLPCFSCLRSY